MNVGLVRQDLQLADLVSVELKNPGLVVIEPDDSVIVGHAFPSFPRRSCRNPWQRP